MKINFKLLLAVTILLSVAGGVNAQAGNKADQAKLPSNRPMPDHKLLLRKLEIMRAHAPKQNAQMRQDNRLTPGQSGTDPSIQAIPDETRRPAQRPAVN